MVAVLYGCAQPTYPEQSEPDIMEFAPVENVIEPESPVNKDQAAALSKEFGLTGCSAVTALREVSADGYLIKSWRVRGGTECFNQWNDRQERYSLLAYLDVSQEERDRLPWLCSETGGHVAACRSQGTDITLLIEQPRSAEFILFRRITKIPE